MNILAIDTSSNYFQIALYIKGETYQYVSPNKADHSQNLVQQIANLAAQNNFLLSDLNEIRVVSGPGSYTGLRIGMSCAQTLKFLYPEIIVKSISNFEFLVTSLRENLLNNVNFFVVLDSGKNKNEYFVQIIMQNSTIEEKMQLISKDKLSSFHIPENSIIVSNCNDLDLANYYYFKNGSISSLVKSIYKFYKRNVEIIYLREIYATRLC